jgi:cytochrome c peroxidase
MMNRHTLRLLLSGALALAVLGLGVRLALPENVPAEKPGSSIKGNANASDPLSGMRSQHSTIRPIPQLPQAELASGKVVLGERLFNDPQISADGTISCASCHILALGGDDGRKLSVGVGGALGSVNAPTVFNSVFNFRQFWDGRAADLVEQAPGPILDPNEMASDWNIVIRRIESDAGYREAFRREYGGTISDATVSDAIARFEATLVTPDAPFDRYLNGDKNAISADALEGYRRFSDYGCISCHQGINIGGNLFQRFGVMGDYFTDRGNLTKADLGRFNITGQEEDRYVFKVPGLRNVAVTAPYFHDGSVTTLNEAVDIMARYQLGRDLSDEDRRYIIAFLESLTGKYRGEHLKP